MEGLHTDKNNNVKVSLLSTDGNQHTQLLNEKLSRKKTLETIKQELVYVKEGILKCLVENIVDQNIEDSICDLMCAFNLNSKEGLESRLEKIQKLHNIYGIDREHHVKEKWNDFDVIVRYMKRLMCTEEELVEQFEMVYRNKMVALARELREAKARGQPVSQHSLWKGFLKDMEIQGPDLCNLVLIMISIPPNSGWVERAYSYLEQVCQKKRNRLDVGNLRAFFLGAIEIGAKRLLKL